MIDDSAMLERTRDAYSFNRYGEEAWMNAIRLLAPLYTEDDVEWILRSKYMRWAADRFGDWSGDPDGDSTKCLDGSEIIKYHDLIGIDIERD